MRKKTLIITVISLIAVTLTSGIVFTTISHAGDNVGKVQDSTPVTSASSGSIGIIDEDDTDYTYIPPTLIDITNAPTEAPGEEIEVPFVPATEMDLELGSITQFINKEHALPKNYRPNDLVYVNVYFDLITYDERTMLRKEAAEAIEKMFAEAKSDGYILSGVSGFRSYDRQKKIFTNNIVEKGKDHTLRYSAVPGTSEHQTGLAIDVSSETADYKLSAEFGNTPEGIWLAENAHRFGYIIRYPKGKYKITGYAYEPWHIRYVGKGLANHLYTNGVTLDEYYKYTPSKGFNFEALYADLINYIPPNVTIIPVEGEGVIIGENGEIINVDDLEEDTVADTEDLEEDPKEDTDGKPGKVTPTLPPVKEDPDTSGTEDPKNDTPKEPTPVPPTPTPADNITAAPNNPDNGEDDPAGGIDDPGNTDSNDTVTATPTPEVTVAP